MTRAIDRLIVSGAIDPDTPAGPRHADRLGAHRASAPTELRSPAATARRSSSSGATRASCCASTAYAPRAGRPSRSGPTSTASSRCSPSCPPARRRRGYRLPELVAAACAAAAPGAPAVVLGARAVRALLVSLLRRAGRRAARGAPGGGCRAADGLKATEIGDAVAPPARARRPARAGRPDVEPVRAWYPGGDRATSSSGSASSSALLRVGARRSASRRSRARGRAAVRVRARRRAAARAARRALARGHARARPRLQDELARPRRRPRRSSRRTTGCSASSMRSRASAPAPTRSRSSTTSSSGRTRSSRRRSTATSCPALEAELSAAIARINRGEFVPTPSDFTCAGCPGARPRVRRPAAAPAAGARCRCRVATSARRGGASGRRSSGSADHRAAGGRARRRQDRARASGTRSSCSCQRDAVRADDRRERQPRHREAVREVPPPRGLSRGAGQEELERDIFATGFYRQKAKALRGTMAMLLAEHDGQVPEEFDELLRLPGRRAQDRERRLGRARQPAGNRGRHARTPALAAPRPHAAGGSGEDRARPDAPRAARRLGAIPAPADLARPADLRRAPSALRGVPARGRPVPV